MGDRDLASKLIEYDRRLAAMEAGQRAAQLGYSSIEDSYVRAYDALGQARQRIGRQSDGSFAVTYSNGTPPPVPTAPVVVAHQLSLVVGWDGTFAGGYDRPADLARVDVHVSEDSGFVPTGATLVGSLVAEGATSFVADNVTHYVRLVAVTTSDVPSAPTDEIGVLPLPAGQIAAGVIGAEQLAAVIVLANRLVAGDPQAARVELDGYEGLQAFNPTGTRTIHVATDGTAMITGEFRTAESGQRLVLNPDGIEPDVLNFYPSEATTNPAVLYSAPVAGAPSQAAIGATASSAHPDGESAGRYYALPAESSLRWGTETSGVTSYVAVSSDRVALFGPYVRLRGDRTGNTDPSIIFEHTDGAGSLISRATLHVYPNPNNAPAMIAGALNVGLVFEQGRMFVVYGNTIDHAPLTVLSLAQSSGSASKTNIEPIPFSALDALRVAPSYMWERPTPPRPVGPGLPPPPPADKFVGPMAEDLPSQLRHYAASEPDTPTVDLGSMTGVAWAAISELADKVDELSARVAALEAPPT